MQISFKNTAKGFCAILVLFGMVTFSSNSIMSLANIMFGLAGFFGITILDQLNQIKRKLNKLEALMESNNINTENLYVQLKE